MPAAVARGASVARQSARHERRLGKRLGASRKARIEATVGGVDDATDATDATDTFDTSGMSAE